MCNFWSSTWILTIKTYWEKGKLTGGSIHVLHKPQTRYKCSKLLRTVTLACLKYYSGYIMENIKANRKENWKGILKKAAYHLGNSMMVVARVPRFGRITMYSSKSCSNLCLYVHMFTLTTEMGGADLNQVDLLSM